MGRTKSGHAIRIIIGSLLGIFGVLALALLVLVIYAGVTRTAIEVGLGTFDVALHPVNGHTSLISNGSSIMSRGSGKRPCLEPHLNRLRTWEVLIDITTCDQWEGMPLRPLPTPVPTSPVPVGVGTVVLPPVPTRGSAP
jgi:hypothetical protein